jgi:hypothetical protein
MAEKEPTVVPLNTSVLAWQREMVEAYARERGFISTSEALRSILTEWHHFKDIRAGIQEEVA